LCEARALPGSEEYLASEKYEIRAWDWDAPGNIIAEISRLNHIRRAIRHCRRIFGISFHNAFNDQILYYSKATGDLQNVFWSPSTSTRAFLRNATSRCRCGSGALRRGRRGGDRPDG